MKTFFRVLSFFTRKERAQLSVLLVLACIGTALEATGIGLIIPLILSIRDPDFITTNSMTDWFYKHFRMTSRGEFVVWLVSALLFFFVIKNVYIGFWNYFLNKFIAKKQTALSTKLFRQHMHAPYEFHLQHNVSEAQNKTINQAFLVCSKVILPFFSVFSEFLILFLLLAAMLAVDPKTTLAVLVGGGLMAFLFLRKLQKKTVSLGKAQVYQTSEMIKWLNQGMNGIKDIKVFGRESYFIKRFSEKVDTYCRNTLSFQTINKVPRLFVETLVIATLFIIVMTGFIQGHTLDQTLSVLTLFAVCSIRLMPSLTTVTANFNLLRYNFAAVNAVRDTLVKLEEIERQQNPAVAVGDVIKSPLSFEESITLKNVSYQYPTASQPALHNISLTLFKGSSTAFVGPSGAGKSTLIDIILGLHKPTSGEILMDGKNIQSNLAQWRKMIGYVPQSPYFPDDTIRRNIAFGVQDEEIDKKRLNEVIELAQLRGVLDRLPRGFDTLLGERAVRLSGGEKQRLNIARALYYDPKILVMDEATSSLDYEIEREISNAIERLKGTVTIILVAHRLSAVKVCDDIYSLSSGTNQGKVDFEELTKRAVG